MGKKIVIVLGSRSGRFASGYLRGRQLAVLLKEYCDRIGLEVEITDQYRNVSESVVIVNKTFIFDEHAAGMIELKKRGNIIYIDLIDYGHEDACDFADVLIASSKLQHLHYLKKYPHKRSVFAAHHVDSRLPAISTAAITEFNCAYVGDKKNALYLDDLMERGALRFVDASNSNDVAWFSELAKYNCHYALRLRQTYDGFKPFTKGFIAARCGAIVLASENDLEAKANLGRDYPFYIDGESVDSVQRGLDVVRASFMGPQWKQALLVMEELRSRVATHVVYEELFEDIARDAR